MLNFSPTKSTEFAVGLDIYSPTDYIINAKDQAIIPTGLRIQVPPGHYRHLCSKSGLAINITFMLELASLTQTILVRLKFYYLT